MSLPVLSDVSGSYSISVSGSNNDMNVIISSSSATITEDGGALGALTLAGDGYVTSLGVLVTTASGHVDTVLEAVNSVTVTNVATEFKYLAPANLLTKPLVSKLRLIPSPPMNVNANILSLYPCYDIWEGMMLPEFFYNCPGSPLGAALLYQLITDPSANTPPSLIDNNQVQEMLATHCEILKAEVLLGFDLKELIDPDLMHPFLEPGVYDGLFTATSLMPTDLAIADASNSINYSKNRWDISKVYDFWDKVNLLKAGVNDVANEWTDVGPGDSLQLFGYYEALSNHHLRKVLLLSGFTTSQINDISSNADPTKGMTDSDVYFQNVVGSELYARLTATAYGQDGVAWGAPMAPCPSTYYNNYVYDLRKLLQLHEL